MAVVIRLQRAGATHRPFYRVVVMDSRKARDSSFLEKVGYYDPMPAEEVIHLEHDRIEDWMRKGAQPTEAVRGLMHRLRTRGNVPAAAAAPAQPKPEPAAPAETESEAPAEEAKTES